MRLKPVNTSMPHSALFPALPAGQLNSGNNSSVSERGDKWRNKKWTALICVFIVVSTLFVYWNVTHYEFVNFDDNQYVTENQHVLKGLSFENIKWAFGTSKSKDRAYWQPLTLISHMIDCQLFGKNAGMHHLTSLLIHIANALLLFIVFTQMSGALWKSAFVAALFALHPLNVESVAWIAERKNVLSTLFWLLTMLAYVRYAKRPCVSKYLAVFTAMALGLMAKPMLVTLPCALLLLDFWPLGRFRFPGREQPGINRFSESSLSRLVLEKIPLLILSVSAIALSSISLEKANRFIPTNVCPMPLRFENAVVSYITYIMKVIWPHNLAVYYPFPVSIPLWQVIASCLILISISIIIIFLAKKAPYLAVGWLWYIGTLTPVIGIVQGGVWPATADRWAYVPAIGLFIIITWGGAAIFSNRRHIRPIRAVIAAAILLSLVIVSRKQVSYWHNSITLFKHALSVTKNNYLSQYNLGLGLARKGFITEAMSHYYETLRLNPENDRAHNNIANILIKKGDLDGAISHYLAALKTNPNSVGILSNLALTLTKKGRLTEAMKYYRASLRLNPKNDNAQINLANALAQQGKLDEAIHHYRVALTLNPKNANAHFNYANALAQKKEFNLAIRQYRLALKIEPDNIEAHKNFGKALFSYGKTKKAGKQFRAALALAPDDPVIYNYLGAVMAAENNIGPAVNYFKKALAIKPDYTEAKKNLQKVLKAKENTMATEAQIQKKIMGQPKNPRLYLDLGNLYLNSHEYDKAMHQYQTALSINPGFTDAMFNIAVIHAMRGKYDKAISFFKKIISLRPDISASYYNMACIFSRRNRKKQAIAWLKKALEHGYGNWINIKNDPDLKNIRTDKDYKALIKKHANYNHG